MATALGKAVNFLQEFGLFDVVLPFLLVFTLVFALLEKTRVLGVEKINNVDTPKKALNAMVAFVAAMLVVSTNKIVTAINIALPNITLLVVVITMFLMLVGMFYKEGEFDFKTSHGKWIAFFSVIIFVIVVLIMLGSIPTDSGRSWLEVSLEYVLDNFSSTVVTSVIFLIVVLAAIYVVVGKSGNGKTTTGQNGSEEN